MASTLSHSTRLKIFVSYNHENVASDATRLRVFIDALEARGDGSYEIFVDYRHPSARAGADLQKFMNEIVTADAVIVILTRGYYQSVKQKDSSGVYNEFRMIYDRLLESEEAGTYNRKFVIVPIILTDTFDSACPREIRHLHAIDLTWLYVIPQQNKKRARSPIRKQLRSLLRAAIEDCAGRLGAISSTRKQDYLFRQKSILKQFLFDDTKSRWYLRENRELFGAAFVKTSTFLRTRDQSVKFIIGRKGSGKSSIVDVLPYSRDPEPAAVLRIEFDQIPFDACFNILRTRPAEASDLRHAFSPIYSYQLIWDCFLHLFLAWSIQNRLERTSVRRLVQKLLSKAMRTAANPEEQFLISTRVLFVYAFEKVVEYLDVLMHRPLTERGLSAVLGEFTPSGARNYVIGELGWRQLQQALRSFDSLIEPVLITADGFDTMVGYFSGHSTNPEEASRFERELLVALFQIILDHGPAKTTGSILYQISRFCIALPYDRFHEAKAVDRDRYKFRHQYSHIEWSGIELSAVVRKRLAILRDTPDPAGPTLEERLASVMRFYPDLPEEIVITYNGVNYHLPLFIYILRHTFWRPRDVLYYYATLLAASEGYRGRRGTLPESFVRQVVAGANRTIIQDEFIKEFQSGFSNLEDVLRVFRYGKQVLSWSMCVEKLAGIKFLTNLPESQTDSMESKIEILFDLGVFGVILSRETAERLSSHKHAFSFNEPRTMRKLDRNDYPQYQYVIHPLFCEYLHLDTSGNPELILYMDWDYLHRNEFLRGMSP